MDNQVRKIKDIGFQNGIKGLVRVFKPNSHIRLN